jgi:hypothetical protein
MATIGSLIVNLIANTSVFDSGLRKGQNSLKGFVSGIAKTQRQVMSFAKGLMVVAGVGGLTYMVKKTMDSIEATAELSDRLNMATEDLISLQYAAEQSGMGAEEMNNALSTFVRRVGEASVSGGAATKVFRELGISAKQLSTNDQTENLKLLADRINQLPTAAERAAVAYDLFGKKGQTMLNLLAGGSAGIDAARQKAEQLGITFSRLDAEQVKAAGDAIKDVKESITGLAQNAVIQLAPSIAAVAEKLSSFISSANNINDIKAAVEGLTVAFGVIVDIINIIKGVLKGLFGLISAAVSIISKAVLGVLTVAEAVWNKIVQWQNKLADTKIGEKLGLEKWAPADFTKDVETFADQSAALTVEAFTGAWDDITDLSTPKIQNWFDEIDARTAAVKKSFAAEAARNQAMAGTGPVQMTEGQVKIQQMVDTSMLGKSNEDIDRYNKMLEFQKMVESEYPGDLATQNQLITQYTGKLEESTRGISVFKTKLADFGMQATNTWANLGDIATTALDGLSASLTELCIKGKTDFKALAVSIMTDILQMMIKMMLMRAIMAAFGMGGPAPGASGAGASVPAMHSGGMAGFAGSLRTVPAFAFAGASRFHSGLAADEFPAILQRGEKVTSRVDVAREDRAAAGPTIQPNMNVKVVNVYDKTQMINAMGTPDGEKKIVNILSRNKGVIAGILR